MFTTSEWFLDAQVRDQQERLQALAHRHSTAKSVRRRVRGLTRQRKASRDEL